MFLNKTTTTIKAIQTKYKIFLKINTPSPKKLMFNKNTFQEYGHKDVPFVR